MGYDDGGNQTQSKSPYAVDPCCKTCTVPHLTKLIGKAPMAYVSKLNCMDHFLYTIFAWLFYLQLRILVARHACDHRHGLKVSQLSLYQYLL